MSVLDSTPDKYQGATRDALDRLDRPYCLGTDADGATHHHSPYDDRVVVVAADGTIEHAVEIGDRTLAAWIGYVQEERGVWQNLNYRDSYGQILKEAFDS